MGDALGLHVEVHIRLVTASGEVLAGEVKAARPLVEFADEDRPSAARDPFSFGEEVLHPTSSAVAPGLSLPVG